MKQRIREDNLTYLVATKPYKNQTCSLIIIIDHPKLSDYVSLCPNVQLGIGVGTEVDPSLPVPLEANKILNH